MAYDDIINKYKKHLTKAQIKALADMEQKYRNLYSQQRAQALNEMTAQGNSMQRALQNMGLAGRHGKLVSGVQKAGNERLTRSYGDYHTQLGRAQNAQLERAAIRMANQTIAAQNAAAQAAYQQQLAQQQAQQGVANIIQNITNASKPNRPNTEELYDQRPMVNASAPEKAAVAQQMKRQVVQGDIDPRHAYISGTKNPSDMRYRSVATQYANKTAEIEQKTATWQQKISRGIEIKKPKNRNEFEIMQEAKRARNDWIAAEREREALMHPEVASLITLSDSDFNLRYDAAERSYKLALQNAKILRQDESSSMEFSNANEIEANATLEFTKWQRAKKARDNAMVQFYNDSVAVEANDAPKAPAWTNYAAPDNWQQAYAKIKDGTWRASDYDTKNADKGERTESKYSALVNEWSFINGNTVGFYSFRGNLNDFFNDIDESARSLSSLFSANGVQVTSKNAYAQFRNQCTNWFYNLHGADATTKQKDQMTAYLTLANLMTADERTRFNALLDQNGKEDADEYFEFLYNNVLPDRLQQQVDLDYDAMLRRETVYDENGNRIGSKDGNDTWLGQLSGSIWSIPGNIVQGATAPMRTMLTGQDDVTAARLGAMRGNTAQGMRNAIQENFSESGRFWYGTGMSAADSATVAMISGGIGNLLQGVGVAANVATKAGSALGGLLLGGASFNASYDEALQRGLSPDKARMTAVGNGINEMLFETLSIGTLLEKTGKSAIKVSKDAWKNIVVNTLVQAGVEGSEEVFTDIANKIWDDKLNGIYSEELQKIREYVDAGYTYDQARDKVKREYAEQLGLSFLGGAVSGGFMGGGAQFVNLLANRQLEAYGKSLSQERIDELKKYDYKSEQAQEILNSDKITNTDAAMLDILHTQELVQESINYIEQAVADGKMPQEIADIYKKFAENNVQTETNPDGITDEEAEKMLPYVDVIKNAEAIKQGLGKIVEQQTAARKEFDALSPEQKQQRLQNITNETTALRNAPSLRVGARESRLSGQSAAQEFTTRAKSDTITLNSDGSVKTANGSVTFDFGANKTVDAMTDNQARAIRFAAAVANKTGANIKVEQEFVGKDRNKNGEYDPTTNTIRVNLSGTNSAIYTISHELTHYLQAKNKQAFADLSKAIQKQLSRTDLVGSDLPTDYQDIIGDYLTGDNTLFEALCAYEKERYAKAGIELTKPKVEEEVIARCCESFLGNSSLVADMTQNHAKSARAVYRFLSEIRADINALRADASERMAERGYASDASPEQSMLEQFADIDKIVKLWENGLRKVAKKNKASGEKMASLSDTQYIDLAKRYESGDKSVEAELRKQVDDAARNAGAATISNGKVKKYYHGTRAEFNSFDIDKSARGMHGYGFYVTMMKDVASRYGDRMLPLYMMTDKLATREDHRITADQVREIVNAYGIPSDLFNVKSIEQLVSEESDVAIIKRLEAYLDDYTTEKPSAYLNAFRDVFGYDGLMLPGENVVWDNTLLKSAELITRDNDGNIIPLSERFKTENADIRYSLSAVDPVNPTSNAWKRTIDTAEAKRRFPTLWDVTADESEVRNPTQIKSTVSTYRKIYNMLKAEGFDGTILDASSGLGYGTKAGQEEYGFNVDDIEPYPDASYKPKYTDYSTLNKKYDVIISNAVLNVIPQDQRDALVVKMGEMLNDGGRIFINTRSKDVDTLASNKRNTKIGNMEWFVADTGSYQKGFTPNELQAYVQDALGDGFTVERSNKFGAAAVIVTKNESQNDQVITNESGDPVMKVTDNGNSTMLSLSTYEKDGRATLKDWLKKQQSKKRISKEDAQYIIDQMEKVYNIATKYEDKYAAFGAWSRAEVTRDKFGKPVFSVIRANGEYPMNLDFSLVCVKRRALDAVLNEIVKSGYMDKLVLDGEALVKVNETIRRHGFETACMGCFVEAKRFRQQGVAETFVGKYNDLVKSLGRDDVSHFNFAQDETIADSEGIVNVPDKELDFTRINELVNQYKAKKKANPSAGQTVEEAIAMELKMNPSSRRLVDVGDFMSTRGMDAVAKDAPSVLTLYNKQKGTGGPKAVFGDMQYLNDVERRYQWTPEKAYKVGGVRVQSFSDFVPRMFFDYCQMVADLSAKKLPAHAYTKEESFVKLFGLTGMKINMSLFPKIANDGLAAGLMYKRSADGDIVFENGEPVITYAWAGESFDYETAKQIQADAKYGKNCGTIAVGISDEHIARMLDDPTIRMIIPYHKSSLNPVVAEMMGIDGFTDYTDQQRTKKDGKAIDVDFAFNQRLHEVGDPKAVVKEYLAWCEKNGYTPKFEQFKDNENYYKLLEDFALFDEQGNYCAQEAVKMVYPEQGDAFGSMDTLLDGYLKRDNDLQEARDAMVPMLAQEIIRQTDKKASLAVSDAMLAGQMHEGAKGARALREQAERYNERIDELNGRIGKLNKRIAELKTQIEDVSLAERMHQGAEDAAALRKVRDEYNERIAQRDRLLEQVRKQRDAAKQHAVEVRKQERAARVRRDIVAVLKRGNDRIVKLLANPTENSHVPVQLAQAVSEYAQRLNELLTTSVPMSGENAGIEKQTKKGALNAQKIIDAYNRSFADEETIALAKAEDPHFDPRGLLPYSEYDETLVKMIETMDSIIQGKRISDLTTEELQFVLNTMRGVIHTVQAANKLIGTTERKAIWQVGDTMVKELESAPKIKGGFARFFLEESLDLRRIAKVFSGSNENAEFVKLSDMLNRGAIEKERVAQVLSGMFDPLTQQYGEEIRKWYGKNAEWIDTGIRQNGRKVEITKGMRVSLAMHVLNAGNMRHIENGGVTIPDKELYAKGKLKDAYANKAGRIVVQLNADQINAIISQMTEAEKAYVEVAKEFFHQRTGYYVNKTSLQLLGYRKATVENYFPIHTNDNYTQSDFASVVRDGSIEGQGFLKERVIAGNPIYLEDITSVVNRQIKGVSLYAGLAVPMRNFKAVMNAQVWHEQDGVWKRRTSVKETMTDALGDYGTKVVQGFLQDVSGMSAVDVTPGERLVAKLQTRYVKAVLLANLKVTLKQAASYPTAAAVIPWKYLNKALLKGGRNQRLISRADVDLINQYTPLYKMRLDGMANEITSIMAERGLEQKMPWLLGWITKMDVATVGRLWSAAEYMVADQQNLPVGSDEYYKAVAEVFNQTIQQTQPNFTPLQRNAALRSKNPVVRTLTLFGTQRMQNGGILIESAMELAHSKNMSKEAQAAAKAKFGRAVVSQLVQNVMLVAIGFVVDALRGRMTAWQDDDKDVTLESVAQVMLDQFLGNIFGSFLGGSEAWDIISTAFKRATNANAYDTEFTVPSLDAIETIIGFFNKDSVSFVQYMSGNHTAEEKIARLKSFSFKVAKAAGYLTGFPFENIAKTIVKGWIPALQDIKDYADTGELIPWLHQSGKLDKAKTAANYKEWTKAGFSGRDYFYYEKLMSDVKGGRDGRIPVLLQSDLTNEQKAMLMRMFDTSGATSDGTKVYAKNGDLVIDFAAPTEKQQALPLPSAEPSAEPSATPAAEPTATPNPLSEAKQEGVRQAVAKGVDEKTANEAFLHYQDLYGTEGRDEEFRSWLFENVKSPESRAVLEYHVLGRASSVEGAVTYRQDGSVYRDYTNESWYALSTNKSKRYEAGKRLEKTGLSVDKTVEIYNGLADYTKKAEWKEYLKKQGLTEEQITIFLWSRGWAKID